MTVPLDDFKDPITEAKDLASLLTKLCDQIDKLKEENADLWEELESLQIKADRANKVVEDYQTKHFEMQKALQRAYEITGRGD